MSYDEIDPELYDRRHELIPREGYLYEHWIPLVEKAIGKYCSNKSTGLDLGCGTGTNFSPLLKKEMDNVIGLDLSIVFLKHGKKRDKNLDLIQGDAHRLPLKNESINVVISNLFEFVDRNIVVKEIYTILKNDGICIVLTLNKYSACAMPSKIIMRLLHKKRDKNEASKKELVNIFKKVGFELIEYKMDDGLIWLPDFLDRSVGKRIYYLIESFFKTFGKNPFSNAMLFVVRKENHATEDEEEIISRRITKRGGDEHG